MKSLANVTLAALFEAAASTNPTPGGGCVSAIGGYFGVSLLLKAIRISAKKQPEESVFATVSERLVELAPKLLRCAEEDSEAFGQYIQALQLPKTNEAEKAIRSKALRDARIAATDVALRALEFGNHVLHCAEQVQDKVLPTILADVRACVELVSSMNVVAHENAQANLSGMTDGDSMRERLRALLARHDALRSNCTR